jgi:hypothetical protein
VQLFLEEQGSNLIRKYDDSRLIDDHYCQLCANMMIALACTHKLKRKIKSFEKDGQPSLCAGKLGSYVRT